jgi:large subunit ribosomal protein L25
MENLQVKARMKNTAHDAKKVRRKGLIPGILYGEKLNNMMFEIGEMELNKEISKGGEHGVLEVDINGSNHKTLIKEIQRDPVNHKIIHIDLEEVSGDKKIISEVPVIFSGEENVGRVGGILQKEKDSVKVQCKADKLPKYININIANCKVGDVYRVSDIEVSSEITFIDSLENVLASVTDANTNMVSIENDEEINPQEVQTKSS